METQALQVLYSLLGSSPTLLAMVYMWGRIDTRISLLEQRQSFLEDNCVRKH